MNQVTQIETGVHEGCATGSGFVRALLCLDGDGREVLHVTSDGEVVIADDLTLDTARATLTALAQKLTRVEGLSS